MKVGDLVRLSDYGHSIKGKNVAGKLGIIISMHSKQNVFRYRVRWFGDGPKEAGHRWFDVLCVSKLEIERVT